jgi:hypothetical protein
MTNKDATQLQQALTNMRTLVRSLKELDVAVRKVAQELNARELQAEVAVRELEAVMIRAGITA